MQVKYLYINIAKKQMQWHVVVNTVYVSIDCFIARAHTWIEVNFWSVCGYNNHITYYYII